MINKLKNNKGITLIALVVTIVILIILATVSINIIFGEGGLLGETQDAKEAHELAEEKQKLQLVKATALINGLGELTVDGYIDELIKEGITTEDDVTDNGDGTKTIITDTGYKVTISPTEDNKDVVINIEEKTGVRKVGITDIKITSGSTSLKVEIEAERAKNATIKIFTKTENSDYELQYEGSDLSYQITDLEENTTYTIRVEATNENGTVAKEVSGRTGAIGDATGIIEFGDLTWDENGQATVTVTKTTEDNNEIQYKINDGEYKTIQSGEEIPEKLNWKDVVTVRVVDEGDTVSAITLNVTDKVEPNAASISFSNTTISTTASMTATVTQSDSQSGINLSECRWVFNTDPAETIDESLYTGTFDSDTITLSSTKAGTYYLHVLTVDAEGNKKQTVSTTSVEVTQIITSITLPATAEVANGKTLTLTPTIEPSDATNKTLTWKSSSTTYATVTDGVVTGKKIGTATITATATDGSGVSATCTVTIRQPTIEDIEVGDWIKYTGGGFSSWRVLYEANNPDINNGKSLQILSAYPVKDVTIGCDDIISSDSSYARITEEGDVYQSVINDYNNYIPNMNGLAQDYINTSYGAVSARAFGTLPTNPDNKATTYFNGGEYSSLSWAANITPAFFGKFLDSCYDNSNLDIQQLENSKMALTSTINDASAFEIDYFWVGHQGVSPLFNYSIDAENPIRFNAYLGRMCHQIYYGVDENGFLIGDTQYAYQWGDCDFASIVRYSTFNARGGTNGFIPVITLSDTLTVSSGSGTKASPWVLQ